MSPYDQARQNVRSAFAKRMINQARLDLTLRQLDRDEKMLQASRNIKHPRS